MKILNYPPLVDGPAPLELKGKFVQLTWRSQEYLIFAPFQLHTYHNQIVAHFLTDEGIAHRWFQEVILLAVDPDLVVIGGGRFHVNPVKRVLKLWDSSQAYGRFDATGLTEKIACSDHPWSDFTIKVC